MKTLKGKDFEDIATNYLIKSGYKIIKRNFKAKFGEIDIIAEKNNVLVFIEVKGRNNNSSVENIDENKIFKIRRVAELYLSIMDLWESNMRFDVLIVRNIGGKVSVEHIEEAF